MQYPAINTIYWKIEDEFLDNIRDYLDELDQKIYKENPVLLVEKIFEYIKENAKLCKLLLSERGGLNFQKRVMVLVYDTIINELSGITRITKEDADYVYSFTITGCVGIVQKWLDDGMKKSARFIADMVIKLTLGLINSLKSNR